MSSSKDEMSPEGEGLENGDQINISSSGRLEEFEVADRHYDEVYVNDQSEMGLKTAAEGNILNNIEVIQADCEETADNLHDESSVSSDKSEIINDSKANLEEPTTNMSEDDNLLSEISKLVDQQVEDTDEAGDKIGSQTEVTDEIMVEVQVESDNAVNSELEGKCQAFEELEMEELKMDVEKENDVEFESQDGLKEHDEHSDIGDNANKTSASEVKKPKVSAVERLASLGLIAEEKPVVEDKETILKKLASRGGISIMPAGSTMPAATSPVTIKPVAAKPGLPKTVSIKSAPSPKHAMPTSITSSPYKPGPKSVKKKIKIDPGKSLDIDKDFNSLITFLSAGADVSSTSVTSSTSEEKTAEIVSDKENDAKPNVQLDLNEASNQSANDGKSSEMDIDTHEEKSFLESESESHDGSKFERSSESEEKTTSINKIKNVIEEGSAEILLSANKNVFYNKVQEFNRDMSIAALTVFSEMHQQDPRTRNRGRKRKAGGDASEADSCHADAQDENVFEAGKKSENGITILEALSATGLRSIRYAREIPGVKEVIANDLSEDAVDTIWRNVEHNGVEHMVTASKNDASLLMYQRQAAQEWYDAVDLDPYGCPSRFLDAAVQAVRDGGLLLVTCTDMAVLAGNSPETCYVKYGAVSLRSPACHEMALRIALQCIESHANRYGRYIVPLLSFSADFYIRLIVQIYTSPVTCKRTTSKLAMVYQCVGCGTHSLHPLGNTTQGGHNTQPKFSLPHGPPVNTTCFHCHHKHCMGGPIWTAPLYNTKFVEGMLRVAETGRFTTAKRMQGMLEVIREELQDVPLYYTVSGLCTKLHCQAIPLIDIRSAILNAGYRVSSSHAAPTAVKTNAPSKIIWDIMRCWVHMNPVSAKRLVAGSVAHAIVSEPPNAIANFDIHPRARPSSAARKLLRYQQNPEKNWGPGARARCNNAEETKDEKRRLNQNKNKNKKHIEIIEVVTIDDEDEVKEDEKEEAKTITEPELELTVESD